MQKLAKTPSKSLPKLPVNTIIIIGSLLGAYLFGSFNPIQELIPVEVNRTDESISIEWKLN